MAVTPDMVQAAVALLRRHGAERVVVFGSSLTAPETARDLDLACSGVPPRDFLPTLADLADHLAISVDLVDLTDDTPFTRLISRRGKVVYERT
jgi:predicted nucleotidyltransferase